jgi:hypothetical protein
MFIEINHIMQIIVTPYQTMHQYLHHRHLGHHNTTIIIIMMIIVIFMIDIIHLQVQIVNQLLQQVDVTKKNIIQQEDLF